MSSENISIPFNVTYVSAILTLSLKTTPEYSYTSGYGVLCSFNTQRDFLGKYILTPNTIYPVNSFHTTGIWWSQSRISKAIPTLCIYLRIESCNSVSLLFLSIYHAWSKLVGISIPYLCFFHYYRLDWGYNNILFTYRIGYPPGKRRIIINSLSLG